MCWCFLMVIKHCRPLFLQQKFPLFFDRPFPNAGSKLPSGPAPGAPFLVDNWGCAAVFAGQAVVAERVRDLQPARDEARQHPAVHRRREARLQHRRRPVAHHRLPREGGAAPPWARSCPEGGRGEQPWKSGIDVELRRIRKKIGSSLHLAARFSLGVSLVQFVFRQLRKLSSGFTDRGVV